MDGDQIEEGVYYLPDSLCQSPVNPFWNSTSFYDTSYPTLSNCFRQSVILTAIPFFIVWAIGLPIEIISLTRADKSRKIRIPTKLGIIKNALLSLMILLSVVDLIRVCLINKVFEGVDLLESLIRLTGFIILIALNFAEKFRGIRTSGFQWSFFVVYIICQSTNLYFYLDHPSGASPWILSSFIINLILSTLYLATHFKAEEEPQYSSTANSNDKLSDDIDKSKETPETSASFPSMMTFEWLTPLMWQGFKRSLTTDDLWTYIPIVHSSVILPNFYSKWNQHKKNKCKKRTREPPSISIKHEKEKNGDLRTSSNEECQNVQIIVKPKANHKEKVNILPVLIKTYAGDFLIGSFAKFCQDVFLLSSPVFLKLAINFVTEAQYENNYTWKGVFIALGLFFSKMLGSFSLTRYFHINYVLGMQLKTSLTSIIYKKSLRISNAAQKDFTTGEIVNLMSVDVQKICDMMPLVNTAWSGPFQIIVAIYLLYQTLGPSAFAGVGVMILIIPINGFIAVKNKNYHLAQMKFKDERIKLMNEIIQGIKILKLYAWEPSFTDMIKVIRDKEVHILRKVAKLSGILVLLMLGVPFFISMITFAVYVIIDPENNILDSEKAFVSIALFNILRFPLSMLPMVLGSITQAIVSFNRINKFLNAEEINEETVEVSNSKTEEKSAIRIKEKSSFTWDMTEDTGNKENFKPTLRDIGLDIPHGSLIAVVGTVGSGKSSLLSAILGEMEFVPSEKGDYDEGSGVIQINGRVAYVAQQAWMQNASLKNNVLFGKAYDSPKYNEIIRSCALLSDLDILPARDETEIGEKGINLSGGQKQRVSLARATYQDADIYLLDDPLSAVDTHVGKQLYDEVIVGLLSNKTRILVTHSLVHLPHVDKIIVMKDGRISETGTYRELLDQKGDFSEFLETYASTNEEENEDNKDDNEELDNKKKNDGTMSAMDEKNGKRSDQYQDEKMETGRVNRSVYFYYIQVTGVTLSLMIFIAYLISEVMIKLSSGWLSIWSDDSFNMTMQYEHNSTDFRSGQFFYIGVYGGIGLVQCILSSVSTIFLNLSLLKASNILHSNMMKGIFRAPMAFFDTTPQGRILNRFGKDIEYLDSKMFWVVFGSVSSGLSFISSMLVITYATPIFILPSSIIMIFYYILLKIYVAASRQLKRLESVANSPIYSHFGETINGVCTIRGYNLQSSFNREFESRLNEYQRRNYPSVTANRWLALRLEMVGNLIVFCAALLAILARDTLSPGIVGLSISFAMTITSALNWMVRQVGDLETNIVSVERIKEYTNTEPEDEWTKNDNVVGESWPEKGAIEFKDYSLRYREGLDLALKNLNVKVDGGQFVGVVGRTGAGKSSLTLGLFRIVEAATGSILIDDVNISDLGLHHLRRKLTIIPQDPILFSGTLRMNLDPLNLFKDEDLWIALEHSHLKSFAEERGLDYVVMEGGDNISVGQRQLICLSRALLRKSKILILDEATAAVDLETDSLIQKTIKEKFTDCTVLTIAHRLNTIIDYDKIIVLDQGQAVEFDTPDKLLANKESIFYSMCKAANLIQ